MLSSSSPSRSSSRSAVATIASRVIGSLRRLRARSGVRWKGGAGRVSSATGLTAYQSLEHCLIERRSYDRTTFDNFEEGCAMTSQTYSRRWIAAVVMMVAAMVDLIDGTIVNVALPTIRRDLHAGAAQVEWVVSA